MTIKLNVPQFCLRLLKRNRGQSLESSVSGIYGDPYGFEGRHAEQRFGVVRAKDYSSGRDFTHEGNFGESEFIFFDRALGQLVDRLTNRFDSRLTKLGAWGQRVGRAGIDKKIRLIAAVCRCYVADSYCDVCQTHRGEEVNLNNYVRQL